MVKRCGDGFGMRFVGNSILFGYLQTLVAGVITLPSTLSFKKTVSVVAIVTCNLK